MRRVLGEIVGQLQAVRIGRQPTGHCGSRRRPRRVEDVEIGHVDRRRGRRDERTPAVAGRPFLVRARRPAPAASVGALVDERARARRATVDGSGVDGARSPRGDVEAAEGGVPAAVASRRAAAVRAPTAAAASRGDQNHKRQTRASQHREPPSVQDGIGPGCAPASSHSRPASPAVRWNAHVRAARDGMQCPHGHRVLVHRVRAARRQDGATRGRLGAGALRRQVRAQLPGVHAGVRQRDGRLHPPPSDQDVAGDRARPPQDARARVAGEHAPVQARVVGAALVVRAQRHAAQRQAAAAARWSSRWARPTANTRSAG